MTINERIVYLRKEVLKLNQTKFAKAIGMKQRGVSTMEQNGNTVTDRAIKAINLKFNISKDWLRDGTGDIYIKPPKFSLDKYLEEKGVDALELEIIKTYFEIDRDTRKAILEIFKERLTASSSEPNTNEPEMAEKELTDTAELGITNEFTIFVPDNDSKDGETKVLKNLSKEEQLEIFRQALDEEEKKVEEKSEVLQKNA